MCCCFPTLTRYPMSYGGCFARPMPMPMMFGGPVCYPMMPMIYGHCNSNPFAAMAGFGLAMGVVGVAGLLINKYC